ncbi:MAG: class I SAM-dependent methyltransferase [Pseudomonadota bacterium]
MKSNKYYDNVARSYADYRQPDLRIAGMLHNALRHHGRVLNVGAGTGSYERRDRDVVAVDASLEMLRNRTRGPAIRARAEALPFASQAFDASLAVLTVHHWHDPRAGLAEMRRVTRGPVAVLTWDPEHPGFWLVNDYFPRIIEIDREIFPPLEVFEAALGAAQVLPVMIPADCTDGFLGAYWRRPTAYLDDGARSAISTFDRIDATEGLGQLRRDLADGRWASRNGGLAELGDLDIGYRLVVSGAT